MWQSIRKYSWPPACDSQFENSPWPPRATVNLKILLDTRVRQSIRKYSWTPSWTVNLKTLLDIRVTVTFQRAFQPSAGLSYWKIGTRQMCIKWLLIIRPVNSVEQCRTVSTVSTVPTVSTVSTVSTVIARCYLHLRWYFFCSISLVLSFVFYQLMIRRHAWGATERLLYIFLPRHSFFPQMSVVFQRNMSPSFSPLGQYLVLCSSIWLGYSEDSLQFQVLFIIVVS